MPEPTVISPVPSAAASKPASAPVSVPVEQPKTFAQAIIGGITNKIVMFAQKHKGKVAAGKSKEDLDYKVRPDFDFTQPDPYSVLRKSVGDQNFYRVINSALYDLADEAAEESVDTTGAINLPTWAVKFAELFVSESRRVGSGKKQLEKKLAEIQLKLQPFAKKTLLILKESKLPIEQRITRFTPEEELAWTQLMIQNAEVSQLYEKRSRTGAKSATAAVAA